MKRLFLVLVLLTACRAEVPEQETAVRPKAQEPALVVADPHSWSRPAEARVEHVSLDLAVDFAKKQLSGTATLRFRNLSNAKSLALDTNGLDIRRVTLRPGGAVAEFTLGKADPVLGQALEIEIARETREVEIEYSSSPGAKALQWLEPEMTAGKKHPFLLSQSQAILARTWVPLQDMPQVRFTYDATLRVPKELMAVMSAENPRAKSADGVYRFEMRESLPSYLMAIAVGDLEFRELDGRCGVYAEPAVVDAAAREFADAPKMVHAAEELYGPYRWGRYDLLVLPPSFPYGGMENPRLTFLTPTVIAGDRSLVSLIAHELAHSWSGNLVTNATWNDFWLNEGVTSYLEYRIVEKLYGRERAEMLWTLGVTDLIEGLAELPPADQWLRVDFSNRDPDEVPTTVYDKGALYLRLIEETAGRPKFDAFLRGYFERFAFRSVTTERFLEHFRQALPGVAEQVNTRAWLFGPGIPPNAPRPQSEAFGRVEALANAFASGAPANSVPVERWSSLEIVHFLESLPNLDPERLESLDRRFRFGESGNSEVRFAWLETALDSRYRGALPALERFLTIQGRRKFVLSLFEKLMKSDPGRARRLYAKVRPSYHPVTQASVDAVVR